MAAGIPHGTTAGADGGTRRYRSRRPGRGLLDLDTSAAGRRGEVTEVDRSLKLVSIELILAGVIGLNLPGVTPP